MQTRDTGSSEDEFCKGYEDYLQCPLQVSTHRISKPCNNNQPLALSKNQSELCQNW